MKSTPRILLIKTGAAGDIVRTTVLLHAIPCRITWVIDQRYMGILPDQHPCIEKMITLENAWQELAGEQFDLTLSLEEDMACARLAASIPARKLIGIYAAQEKIKYTANAAGWFDMGLFSRHGLAAANALKKENKEPFQYWLLQMLGIPFRGESYCIYSPPSIASRKGIIGFETRVGERWPNKAWAGYTALKEKLEEEGYSCKTFSQQQDIRSYLHEIASCSLLISGDTLAMHVAMAYQIPCIAIFNCTSPSEIFDYGLLKKAVSPVLDQYYYSQHFSQTAIESVSVPTVYALFKHHQLLQLPVEKA